MTAIGLRESVCEILKQRETRRVLGLKQEKVKPHVAVCMPKRCTESVFEGRSSRQLRCDPYHRLSTSAELRDDLHLFAFLREVGVKIEMLCISFQQVPKIVGANRKNNSSIPLL